MFLSLQLDLSSDLFIFCKKSFFIAVRSINFFSLNFFNLFFFSFKLIKLFFNVRIIKVCNILSKVELGRFIILPVRLFKNVMLLIRIRPITSSSFLISNFFNCFSFFWSFYILKNRLWDNWRSVCSSTFWLSNMNSVKNIFCFLWIFGLLS